MTDNKLATGRKMLIEFQKRKTEKKSTEHVNNKSEAFYTNQESVTSPIPTASSDISPRNIKNNVEPPEYFFDKCIDGHKNEDQHTKNENLPLAGILFASQNNGNDSDFFQDKSVKTQPHQIIQTTNEKVTTDHANFEQEPVQDLRKMVEISKLQQQLQFHIKTVEFLVTEKNDLIEKVDESEKKIEDLKSQTADLTGRLNISRHRVSHLEAECGQLKQKNEIAQQQIAKLVSESTSWLSLENVYKKQLQDVQEELQEMKTLMDDKVSDYKLLLKKYEEINSQCQLNELRFQQVIQGNERVHQDQSLQEHCQNLEQLVNSLRQQLSQLESEKNHSSIHYQQYVQQLNYQIQNLNEKQEELINENEKLQNQEQSLIQQMGALEKQLQKNLVQNVAEVITVTNDVQQEERIHELERELSEIKTQLSETKTFLNVAKQDNDTKQEEIQELTNNILKMQSESPDLAKLNAAIESDRLAAQKATSQNAKMKLDLGHLEKAFEQMTNSKLELAELLQAEKNLSKTLTMKLVETEEKLKEVETKLMAKDEEMIRLQSASSDLEKEILKHAQVSDRLSHYEAQTKSLELIQAEYQTAKSTVQMLTNENAKLKKMFHQIEHGQDSKNLDLENDATSNAVSEENIQSFKSLTTAEEGCTVTLNLPTADAMSKLEEKFKKLMNEVADLSDEKQKLEHIVLQLQGETETICEYIALYQKQRSMLRQREAERNAQLNMLAKEREHMKGQLEELKSLVSKLHRKEDPGGTSNNPPEISKILDLVMDIKGNHLIEPNENCSDLSNFHHCPWCSGKLITI